MDDANEESIVEGGGVPAILECARLTSDPELLAQIARALRNLSVSKKGKDAISALGGIAMLTKLADSNSDRIKLQATRALANLGQLTAGIQQ